MGFLEYSTGHMTDSPDDRRDASRAPIELKVEYKRLNTFFADYTRNISRGGTFIRTDRPLDIGTEFVFALVVPHVGEPLRLKGRVQWVTVDNEWKTDALVEQVVKAAQAR